MPIGFVADALFTAMPVASLCYKIRVKLYIQQIFEQQNAEKIKLCVLFLSQRIKTATELVVKRKVFVTFVPQERLLTNKNKIL